jgi:7-cyano-7-deazaguanine synthase
MRYGCQAEVKEMQAIYDIAREVDCSFEYVETDWLRRLGGSSLTEGGDIKPGETGAEFCHEWVPARNLLFLSMCAAISEVRGCSRIYMGLNLEEAGAYPDNTVEFYESCNRALIYGTLNQVQIVNPLGNLMKWEIVKKALEIGAPIDKSWSCYKGGEKPCGNCGPCYMRKKAFKMNNIQDMIEYQE